MQSGSILADKYRLESLLGRGGMGSVWRAEHLGLRAPVAVKLIDPAIAESPDALARFHREAHSAASIRSQNVVQMLDHGVDPKTNTPFIVMELLEGETLGQRLTREKRLAPAETVRILSDVCRALSRAHQAAIVHRDLKPDNIFLVNDEREFAKVLDFGVAKADPYALGGSESTRTGALIGTPYYMSPEQISGSKSIDSRSDLWAVAVIACECVTGCRPFEADSVGGMALVICARPAPRASSLGPTTPAFDAWLARALDRDLTRRFQTAGELAATLSAVLTEAPTAPESQPQPQPKPRSLPSAKGDTLPGPLSTTSGASTTIFSKRTHSGRVVAAVAAFVGLIAAAAWLALSRPNEGGGQSPVVSAAPSPEPPSAASAIHPPAPTGSEPAAAVAPVEDNEPQPSAAAPEPSTPKEPRVSPVALAPQAPVVLVEEEPPVKPELSGATQKNTPIVKTPGRATPRVTTPAVKSSRATTPAVTSPTTTTPTLTSATEAEPAKKRSRREILQELLEGDR